MRFFALLRMTECHWSTFYESIIIEIEKKADQIVEKTKSFFEKVTSNIRIVANDEHLINSGIIYKRSHLENLLYKNDYLAEVTFLNEKGKEILKISKYKVYSLSDLRDYSMTEMFRRASKGEIYYGDFYPASNGAPTMVVSMPIEVPQRKITGVLSATIHLRYLWNLLLQTQVGKKGTTYVVDREGDLVAPTDTRRVTSRTTLRHLPMVDRAIAGEEGNLEFEDSGGRSI
jgi:hypothetical protein